MVHRAPSVGFSQPWNIIIVKNKSIRQQVKNSFFREHKRSISILDEDAIQKQHGYDTKQKVLRKEKYLSLKLDGIIESAVNICVTYDSLDLDLLCLAGDLFLKLAFTVFAVRFKIFGLLLEQKI